MDNHLPNIKFSLTDGIAWETPQTYDTHHDFIELPSGDYLGIANHLQNGPVFPDNIYYDDYDTFGCTPDGVTPCWPWKGDRLVISSAGGGGYGHPYERAIRLLSKDMKSGFLSRREAAMNHGVVYQNEDGTDYDSNKTFRLRSYKLTIADIEGILDEIQDMDSS